MLLFVHVSEEYLKSSSLSRFGCVYIRLCVYVFMYICTFMYVKFTFIYIFRYMYIHLCIFISDIMSIQEIIVCVTWMFWHRFHHLNVRLNISTYFLICTHRTSSRYRQRTDSEDKTHTCKDAHISMCNNTRMKKS